MYVCEYIIQELPVHQRADAVSSIVYEANARMRDPVYGCVGAISYLQNQVSELKMQLAVAHAEILCIQMQQDQSMVETSPPLIVDPAADDHDHKKQYFFGENDNLVPPHDQYFHKFASASNIDSFKRETIFGHDMVSW